MVLFNVKNVYIYVSPLIQNQVLTLSFTGVNVYC